MEDQAFMELLSSLYKQRRAAEDKYFELRDAKSNGCCHDMTIPEILIYDSKIMAAKHEIERIDAEINQSLEAHRNK